MCNVFGKGLKGCWEAQFSELGIFQRLLFTELHQLDFDIMIWIILTTAHWLPKKSISQLCLWLPGKGVAWAGCNRAAVIQLLKEEKQ